MTRCRGPKPGVASRQRELAHWRSFFQTEEMQASSQNKRYREEEEEPGTKHRKTIILDEEEDEYQPGSTPSLPLAAPVLVRQQGYEQQKDTKCILAIVQRCGFAPLSAAPVARPVPPPPPPPPSEPMRELKRAYDQFLCKISGKIPDRALVGMLQKRQKQVIGGMSDTHFRAVFNKGK